MGDAVHCCDGLCCQIPQTLSQSIEIALSVLVREEMELSHAVNERSSATDREDLLKTLLKVSQKTEDTVILNCSLE